MRLLAGESRDDFEDLYQRILKECSPQGALEEMCVERIVMAHWRLRRLWRVEAEVMEHLMNEEAEPQDKKADTRLGVSMQRELNQAVSFESLQRYEVAIERQLRRAIGEFLLMRKIIPNLAEGDARIIAYQKLLG